MRRIVIVAICGVAALAAGCGSSSSSSNSSSGSGSATSGASGTTNSSPGALSAEAKSTASGDIPDSQVFVTLHGAAFSMQYPEGWVQRGSGSDVTLQDKNNLVHLVVRRGARSGAGRAPGRTGAPTPEADDAVAAGGRSELGHGRQDAGDQGVLLDAERR